ncbi:transcriptional regulator [Rhodococcus sp. WMMA185]|uniref:helix-turn-helix transcriptional regulator n=1 Tax=Rhodococcus sp. WMMA185 TaxID=679318 RepID=UPI0008791DE8|nr:WYL domain-containing protein [Rhodococcus sp. WMMA185]AOW91796.1 transcriptional regulator [Rhodococcus sp. WMMA185]
MRSSRLVEIMLRLEGSRGVTAQRLADELDVSVRTVYRDVAALSAAGVPMWTESGPGGGVRLLDGWQSKLGSMTGAETSALMLLGVPSIAEDLGLREVATAAQSKLLRALPLPLRIDAQVWRDRLYVDAPGWFNRPRDVSRLPDVAAAVLEGRRLRVSYRTGNRTATRTLDPLGLVAKAGVWYLVAQHRRHTLSYRVSRIEEVTVLDEPATRPANFDLARWWSDSVAEFDRALLRFDCRVRLSPAAWRHLPHAIGVEAARVEPGPPDDDGWFTVHLRLEAEDVARDQLTSLGSDVEVLEPQSLRRALWGVGAAMMRRNG